MCKGLALFGAISNHYLKVAQSSSYAQVFYDVFACWSL